MAGIFGAFIGVLLVLSVLGWINRSGVDNQERDGKSPVVFDIEKVRKKKSVVKSIPKIKKIVKKSEAPRPELDSFLRGRSFGLSQFENVDLVEGIFSGGIKNVAMTEDTVDELPSTSFRPSLDYPKNALGKKLEGFVTFNLLVDDHGQVVRAKILKSFPKGVFDRAALANVSEWLFKPAFYQGKAVKVWVKQKITFRLN